MRLFYLQNEAGKRQALNYETGIFLTNPEGLGLEFSGTFADLDHGFFKYVSKKYNQKSFGATLNFFNDPYRRYHDFVKWCMASEKLYLVYNPFGTEFFIPIEIESFDKKELNKLGYLEVPIKLKYLTPWQTFNNKVVSSMDKDTNPFRFGDSCEASQLPDPLAYNKGSKLDGPDRLESGYGVRYSVEVSSNGQFPAAIVLEYNGKANHPVIMLEEMQVDGHFEETARCSILKDFETDSNIVFSTEYENSYIATKNILGKEESLLSYVDISTDPFFRIPIGKECRIRIADDNALDGEITCVIHDYYRSV